MKSSPIWLFLLAGNFIINYLYCIYSGFYSTPWGKDLKQYDEWGSAQHTRNRFWGFFITICPFIICIFIISWMHKEYKKEAADAERKEKIREKNRQNKTRRR